MGKNVAILMLLVVIFSGAPEANAQTKGIECRKSVPGSCGGGATHGSGGSSNNATGQLLGLGAALIIQGLSSADDDNDADEQRKQLQYERERAATERKERQAKIDADRLFKESAKADGTNPFGPKRASADTPKKTQTKGKPRAPYADSSCVDFKPSGSGITADNVRITNKCAFPIQVLHCFYRRGENSKCHPSTGNRWGVTSTIAPGGRTVAIAYSTEWDVAYYVCNMSGTKNYEKFCLRPQ